MSAPNVSGEDRNRRVYYRWNNDRQVWQYFDRMADRWRNSRTSGVPRDVGSFGTRVLEYAETWCEREVSAA